MDIQNLINNNPDGVAIISLSDLKEFAVTILKESNSPAPQENSSQASIMSEDISLSSEQVAQILNVDKSTLWRWAKSGYLLPYKIGHKNYYSRSEIEELLKKKR